MVMVIAVGVVVVQRIVGTSAVNAFFYPGTIGVLSLLVAYIVTNVGAIRFLWIGARRAPLWQIPIPLIAIAFLVYTIDKQVSGQTFPYDRFPWVVAGWLLLSLVESAPAPARRGGLRAVRAGRHRRISPPAVDHPAGGSWAVRHQITAPAAPDAIGEYPR